MGALEKVLPDEIVRTTLWPGSIDGVVIQGLQAAGLQTLVRQMPHFQTVIPEMKGLHPATINLQLEGALRMGVRKLIVC